MTTAIPVPLLTLLRYTLEVLKAEDVDVVADSAGLRWRLNSNMIAGHCERFCLCCGHYGNPCQLMDIPSGSLPLPSLYEQHSPGVRMFVAVVGLDSVERTFSLTLSSS